MKKIIWALILSMATCTIANAEHSHGPDGDDQKWSKGHDDDSGWNHHQVVGAPEIDPASAISGLTLLVGGLTVLRGRRTKK